MNFTQEMCQNGEEDPQGSSLAWTWGSSNMNITPKCRNESKRPHLFGLVGLGFIKYELYSKMVQIFQNGEKNP